MVTSDESESEPEPQPAEEEAGEHTEEENEKSEAEPEAEPEVEPETKPEDEEATPKSHPPTQATYGRSPTKTPSVPNVSNGTTPISTLKRRRTDEDDDEHEDAGDKSEVEANGDANASGDEAPRQENPSNEFVFGRKRARH